MTITKHFIDKAAHRHGLEFPDDLRDWLLRQYGWEPYEGFWDEALLEELVMLNYTAYKKGNIDTTPPSGSELWRERFFQLKDCVEELVCEYNELVRAHDQALELLELNHIDH